MKNVQDLAEAVCQTGNKKRPDCQPITITGGRMISIEEASRFAIGFDDPARLSSAFAGVAEMSAPMQLPSGKRSTIYPMETGGIEIPNPYHFADLSVWAEDSCPV